MAIASSEPNSDGRTERVTTDRERITALLERESATVLASIDRDAPREEIREELKEVAIELLRVVLEDRAERARTDGAAAHSTPSRCPRCDAEIDAISSPGPTDHRFSPCGHRASERHARRLVDDPELWLGGRVS